MKLIEYMPQYLKNIREFQEIFKSEDEQLEYMSNLIAKMLTEVIVKTADSYGLERYEKIYNITDIATTIEARRTNILLKMNNRVPYSKKWLANLLDAVIGKDKYILSIDESTYSINIEMSLTYSEAAETLKKELSLEIPANMKLQYDFSTEIKLYTAVIVMQQSEYMTIDAVPNESEETIDLNTQEYLGFVLEEKENINIGGLV